MTDAAYRQWIQKQKSCISGRFSEYVDGDGRCEAAHVRRAATSGTGYKGEFCCVPMTRAEHDLQHRAGELACLKTYLPNFKGDKYDAKDWFDYQVIIHRQKWEAQNVDSANV